MVGWQMCNSKRWQKQYNVCKLLHQKSYIFSGFAKNIRFICPKRNEIKKSISLHIDLYLCTSFKRKNGHAIVPKAGFTSLESVRPPCVKPRVKAELKCL